MKLLLTLILLTGCAQLPQGSQFYAGHWWMLDPDCIPAKEVTWVTVVDRANYELQCGQVEAFRNAGACTKHRGDKAYIYSVHTEMQAESIDSSGISLKQHEYIHAKQCLAHPH